MSLIFPFYGGWYFCKPTFVYLNISIAKRPSFTILPDVHQISGLHLWAVFRRKNVVMGIDVRWVSLGRRDVVSYHKWMTSYNFFDFGVTCSTFISLCPNIRNTGLYFYLAFDFFKIWRTFLFTRIKIASRCKMHPLSFEN
jgi:hypothetical protein